MKPRERSLTRIPGQATEFRIMLGSISSTVICITDAGLIRCESLLPAIVLVSESSAHA